MKRMVISLGLMLFVLIGLRAIAGRADVSARDQAPPQINAGAGTDDARSAYSSNLLDCWSVVASPNVGTNSNRLHGVAVLSSSDIWSVGFYHTGLAWQTLLEHWDGSAWSVVSSPNAGTGDNQLQGVAATSSSDVWAVGRYHTNSVDQTLIEHWNGGSWSIVPSPKTGTGNSHLRKVAALSSSNVWTVGFYVNASNVTQTLVEHWDGNTWSIIASPNVDPFNSEFSGIAALTSNDVWAVGSYVNGSALQTLTEHWNGSAWSIVPSPNLSDNENVLDGVTAIASNDAWAIGDYRLTSSSAYQALAEHWDGSTWSVVPIPNVGASDNIHLGVAAVSSGDAWTVGQYRDSSSVNRTLVQRYNACVASPTVTPTQTGGTATPSRTATVGPSATPPPCGVQPNWVTGPSHDPARGLFQGAAATDGKFYEAGGQNPVGTNVYGEAARFNPNSNTWESLPLLPRPVGQVAAGADAGKVFVAGGCYICAGTSYAITSTLQIFDIAGNSWSFGAPLPAPVEAAAGVALNGKFYVIGGDDINTPQRTTYIYAIAENSWTTGPQIPDPQGRTDTYAAAANGLVYVFGGLSSLGQAIDTMISYNPGTNAWQTLASANLGGLGNFAAVSAYGPGKLLVADGGNASFNPAATTHIYDIASNSYITGPTLLQPLLGHAQGSLPDGRVIVYGGVYMGGGTPRVTNASALLAQPAVCSTATATATPSNTAIVTPPAPSATITNTPSATRTGLPTQTVTPCTVVFVDVPPTDPFYTYIRYLYCEGVISGYNDGTFRPGNPTTRGQLTKIVVLARGWAVQCPTTAHFSDVPIGNVFFCFVETAYSHGIISGYNDGTFRPSNNVTRAQLSKIVVISMGWTLLCPSTAHFTDVPTGDLFFCFVETAFSHGIISGYSDGTFRPANAATRAQICKIVYLAVTNP